MTNALNIAAALNAAREIDAHVLSLPNKQMEGVAYRLLKTRFVTFFESAVRTLMATPESETKRVLGNLVDYRTRLLAQKVKVSEELVQSFRYALLNVLRDEAFMRAKPERSERFCSVHTAKGRMDEGMPLIKDALAELNAICGTCSPVYGETRVESAEASLYANDERQLITETTAHDVRQLLLSAAVHVNFGESVYDQLRGWNMALAVISTHTHFATAQGGFVPHMDRLKTARALRTQLFNAQQARTTCHEYTIRGDRVRVPHIAERSPLSAVTLYVVTKGWTVIASGMVDRVDQAHLEDDLKAEHGEDVQVFTA